MNSRLSRVDDQPRPQKAPRWRLLLADDHDIIITGLRSVLDEAEFQIIGAVKDGRALVQAWKDLKPDLVITDVTMLLLNGIEAARQIRKLDPNVKFVFVTMHPDIGYATEAMALGNNGYILKTSVADELPVAIRTVLEGRCYVAREIADPVQQALETAAGSRTGKSSLSFRQCEVLQLLAEGRAPKEIALILNVSIRTVEFHKYRIMEALDTHSTAELVRAAIGLGLISS